MSSVKCRLTIAIAAYNAERDIKRLIESIPVRDDIEIVVVNDGSRDRTEDVLNGIKTSRNQRIVIVGQENQGVSVARNNAIAHSSGEWIMFCDADDWVNAEALLRCLQKIDERTEAVVFGIDIHSVDGVRHNAMQDKVFPITEFLSGANFREASWNYLFRLDIIKRYAIEFPSGIICTEDQNFNLKYMMFCKSILSVNEQVYNYNRLNDNSASQKRHGSKWIKSRLLSANDLLRFCLAFSMEVETLHSQIQRLYESYMNDWSTDISFAERRRFFKEQYRITGEMIPSFKDIRKFKVCYWGFGLGVVLFRVHLALNK